MSANWWDDLPKADPLDAALALEGASGTLAELAKSVYAQESGSGKNTATSNAGAVGGMQILPGTFKEVADKGMNINDPVDNARAGVRYLAKMLDRADGDPALAAAGYYGGPGGLDKAKEGQAVSDPRNPNAPTTLQYGQQVVARMGGEPKAGKTDKPTGNWWESFPVVDDQKPSKSAPQVKPAEDKPGVLSQLARQAGLTARAAIGGVTAIPAMAADAVAAPVNAALDLVRGEGNGFRFPKQAEAVSSALDAIGLPRPQNATERVSQDVAGAMVGGAGFVKAGQVLAKGAGEVTQGVGRMLAAGPGGQVAAGAASAGASGTVRESGGDGVSQAGAALLGALAPSALPAAGGAAVRGVLRGGEAGRTAAAERLAAFEAVGVDPTLAQVTGGVGARTIESAAARTPGGYRLMTEYAEKQLRDMSSAVKQLADDLSPGANAITAGEAVQRGIKTVERGLYRKLDLLIPANRAIAIDNTTEALAKLNADIPGAPNLSQLFKNAKISGIERAALEDLDAAAAAGSGGLPFQAVKKLRTLVGNELANNSLVSEVPRSKWLPLYAALSEDIGVAAQGAGPGAMEAWKWANNFTRTQTARLEELNSIVGRDTPEAVFRAATSGTTEGGTIARRIISVLPRAERRELASALLQRLGRATPGQQDAAGDAFSSEAFLTNLARMSPDARKTLFGRTDVDEVLSRIDQFASVAEARRQGGRMFDGNVDNVSRAAQFGLAGGVAGGLVSAAAGRPGPLMAVAAVPVAANLAARAATSPALRQMAATSTTVNPGAEASLVGAVSRAGLGDVPAMPSAGGGNATAYGGTQQAGPWGELPGVDLSGSGVPSVPGGAAPRVIDPMIPDVLPQELPEVIPVDTRGTLERIGRAKTVDEAIAAAQDPMEPSKREREMTAAERDRAKLAASRTVILEKQQRLADENRRLNIERMAARHQRVMAEREKLATMRYRALLERGEASLLD